jgi:hypothetical protein
VFHDEKYVLAIAKTFDRQQNYEKAIFYYEQYLKFGVFADNSEKVRERIEQIKEQTSFGKELVYIKVIPLDATIYLDEESPYTKIKNPFEGFLTWGKHKLIIKKEDYKGKTVVFDVKKNQKISKIFKLERVIRQLKFTLKSNPPGAKLYIDDHYMGKTPVEIKINEGYYNVRLEKDELKIEKIVEFSQGIGNKISFDFKEKQKPQSKKTIAKKLFKKKKNKKSGTIVVIKRKKSILKPIGWAAFGTGLALLAGGGVFTYFAIQEAGKAESLDFWKLQKIGKYDEEFQKKIDFANKNLNLSVYMYIGGGVLFAGGVTMLILDSVLGKKKELKSFGLIPTINGAAFSYKF